MDVLYNDSANAKVVKISYANHRVKRVLTVLWSAEAPFEGEVQQALVGWKPLLDISLPP
jgi:hypothetical protein